jgi:hypothetical protein
MKAGEHVLAFAAWKSILRDPAARAAARTANDGRRIRETSCIHWMSALDLFR